MSSSRLPGKVMQKVAGEPMLYRIWQRLQPLFSRAQFVVATSVDPSDDVIAEMCENRKISCYRGSLGDVLDRYYYAAKSLAGDAVIRITGDCPLIDPVVVENVLNFYLHGKYDYVSNALKPTFPDGLDTEVFSFAALEDAWKSAELKSEREHVTSYIYNNPKKFNIGKYQNSEDYSHMRWTVDYPDDLLFVGKIYEALWNKNACFQMHEIISFLKENPQVGSLQEKHTRNEGYTLSLKADSKQAKAKE